MAALAIPSRTRLTALLLLVAYVPACHSWRSEAATPQAVIEAKRPDQIRIIRTDGTRQVLHQPAVVGDTLRGTSREPPIPLSDVQTLQTRHEEGGKSILLGLGVIGGVVVVAGIVCRATDCLDLGFGN